MSIAQRALIPYHRVVVRSCRPVPDVVALIEASLQPPQVHGLSQERAAFRGIIRGTAFTLGLVEDGMNTYAPWIRGQVAPAADGSQVVAVMTVHPIAWVLVAAFFGSMWWFEGVRPTSAIALFGAFHIAMCVVGFWPTARRAENALRRTAAQFRG